MTLREKCSKSPKEAQKLLLKLVQKNEAFEDCATLEEYEKEFNMLFKRKCSKCKKSLFITKYSIKENKEEYFKLCDQCRIQMRELSRMK